MIYETTFVVSQELQQEKIEEFIAKIIKIVETLKGAVTKVQQFGKRKLAYSINKFRDGSYVYVEFNGSGEVVNSLEKFFKVNDSVMRFLTVKVNKKKNIKKSLMKPEVQTPEAKQDEQSAE
jgi:small subunit ribosomal protein S6